MRSILIVLVLVNVLWAVWSLTSGRAEGSAGPDQSRAEGHGILLLSELPPGELRARTVASTEAAAKASAEAEPKPQTPPADLSRALASLDAAGIDVEQQNCVAMGPFDELERVEAVRAEILADGGTAEIVTEEVESQPDYLVYIDTTGSRALARRIREELEGQRIDSHIIAGGDLENALSVGVFSREVLAHRQRDRVSALGYEVAVHELLRHQTVYHLLSDRTVADPAVPGRSACHEIASLH